MNKQKNETIRIVSLAPNITEIIYFLGLEEYLVGVTAACDYPPAAQAKASSGRFGFPDLEKVIALQPTIILSTGFATHPLKERLQQFSIPYRDYPARTLADIEFIMRDIISIIEKTENTSLPANYALVDNWRQALDNISRFNHAKTKKPTIYLKLWPNSLMTAGAGTFVDEAINLAGGQNIGADRFGDYPSLTAEYLLTHQPDIVIIMHQKTDEPLLPPVLKQKLFNANSSKLKVFYLDPDIILRPSPRLLEGIRKLRAIINQ